ncbi:MAG: tetratricopeptide repeat protein [Thermofilum sp.]
MPRDIYTREEVHTGAWATPELVGRDAYLKQIYRALTDTSRSYVIYITGEGGIGKTRLVQHVLQNPPDVPSLVVASRLIDLYHSQVRTLAGLIGAILEVVEPLSDFFRAQVETGKLEALARAEQEGLSIAEVISLRKDATQFFLRVFNQFTQEHRVVLALDTAEHLFAHEDPSQKALGLEDVYPSLLQWLLDEFLPNVQNTVILLAGRPGPGNLKEILKQRLEDSAERSLEMIELPGLNEEESIRYIQAVIRAARDRGALDAAEFIQNWGNDNWRTAFYCLCDDSNPPTVRPILLALAVDYLVVAGRPLDGLVMPLEQARSLSSNQREQIREALVKELIHIIGDKRSPADEIIIALGWLRKGANATLLAYVTGMELEIIETALEGLKQLSFIKTRPVDQRIFLHDEMYGAVQRHFLEGQEARWRSVARVLQEYYQEQVDAARQQIAKLYQPLGEQRQDQVLPASHEVIRTRARLQDAMVENLFYQLRHEPSQGFQKYYLYAEEATATADESLDMQLRAELMAFLAERESPSQPSEIDGLSRADVIADAAVRWLKRLINKGDYTRAVQVARSTAMADFVARSGTWAQADLKAWEALALAYQGHLEEARKLLNEAALMLDGLKPGLAREKSILAHVYNNRGYVLRALGCYFGAIRDYEMALSIWREMDLGVEAANTLNNLAFAQAEVGRLDAAERLAKTALALREEAGPRSPVGLSINTLAHIAIRGNFLVTARERAERACNLFQLLGDLRGEGLAKIALAEALRRWGEQKDESESLQMAIQVAEEGVNICERLAALDRQVEALIELGCAYRDLAKVVRGPLPRKRDASHISEQVKRIAEKGKEALRRAAEIARAQKVVGRQIDALVNLAWLHYYILEEDQALAELEKAQKLIPAEFYITNRGRPHINRGEAIVPALMQLGKIELLRGQICFNEYQHRDDLSRLEQAIEHYALSLEYDFLASDQIFRDMRRGMDRIYERLSSLPPQTQSTLDKIVANVEAKYKLGASHLRRFLKENYLMP